MIPKTPTEVQRLEDFARIHRIPLTFIPKDLSHCDLVYSDQISIITPESIRVGWDDLYILNRDDPQRSIYTKGIATCFTIFGLTPTEDILVGHFFRSTTSAKIKEAIRTAMIRSSKIPTDFSYTVFYGPLHSEREEPVVEEYNLEYIRDQGIRVIGYGNLIQQAQNI